MVRIEGNSKYKALSATISPLQSADQHLPCYFFKYYSNSCTRIFMIVDPVTVSAQLKCIIHLGSRVKLIRLGWEVPSN